jgi:hypothetical protein
MRRSILTTGWTLFVAAAALMAQHGADTPRYVAVELNLDGAVRDSGAQQRDERGALAGDSEMQVGSAGMGAHSHAMVWQATTQSAVDLHEFLSRQYTDSMATGVDEAGNVTGVAIDVDGHAHDILWRAARGRLRTASGGSGGGGGGGGSTTDKVSITRALWFGNAMAAPTGELLVQATSSRQDAVLTMTDSTTGGFIATLPNLGGGRYGGTVIFRFNPVTSVTVTSNLGGTNTRSVIIGVQ